MCSIRMESGFCSATSGTEQVSDSESLKTVLRVEQGSKSDSFESLQMCCPSRMFWKIIETNEIILGEKEEKYKQQGNSIIIVHIDASF